MPSAKGLLLNPMSLAVGATGLATIGGVGVPAALRAASEPQPPAPTLVMPEDPVRREVFLGLREIAQSGRMVLHVEPGGDGRDAWAAFWTSDRRAPGQLNESELLVIAHNRLLQTITVHASPDRAAEDDAIVPLAVGASSSALELVRARSDIEASVIGVGVSDMTLAWTGQHEGEGRLRFALIWARQVADSSQESEPSSVPSAFTVNLPGVLPAR